MPSTDGAESGDDAAICADRPDGADAATCAAGAADRHDGGCGGANDAIRDESIHVGDDDRPLILAVAVPVAVAVAFVVSSFLYSKEILFFTQVGEIP